MRRAPIVLAATAAGLAAVLGFHTQKLRTSVLSGLSGVGTTPTSLPSGGGGTTTTTPGSSTTTPGSSSTTPSTSASTGTHTALGADVQYQYGELELKVTVTGGKITNVQPAIDNAFDPRSAQVNAYAEPQLESQTLQAQSANINGVSGATYTSQAYVQSLQAALDKLGIK
ncbi:MAG TPA: FMN-binding protein [Acidimicrobiales bacterium]|nr:FMN-binding protein [Acidimicrobiales bacterium]